MKKKYALVGLGARGTLMYLEPLVKKYNDVAEVVALCDKNPLRAAVGKKQLELEAPIYDNFEEMQAQIPFDTLIVATPDNTHHEFIVKALSLGKDVIVEKPLTTDEFKCRAILKAEQASGKKVVVTFNYRFTPYVTKIKEFIASGRLGEIFSVNLNWYLDTLHGADYYRRWHAELKNSGGLLVHKSTHHFDLINWFLMQEPDLVYAMAALNYYGQHRQQHGQRCLTCAYQEECPFYLDLKTYHPVLKEFYLDTEIGDGYWRDQCVFADRINIYDTMSVMVKYKQGTILNYTLHSFMPFEGWSLTINGAKGRLECSVADTFYSQEERNLAKRANNVQIVDPARAAFGDCSSVTCDFIRFYPTFGGVEVIEVPRVEGDHAGGDDRLRDHLFRGNLSDPLGHMADSWAGAMSALIGIAANKSIRLGEQIRISHLLEDRQ